MKNFMMPWSYFFHFRSSAFLPRMVFIAGIQFLCSVSAFGELGGMYEYSYRLQREADIKQGLHWLFAFVLVSLFIGAFTWFFARRKKLIPWLWLFSAGPIGLAVLSCLPSPAKASDAVLQKKRRITGNLCGILLTAGSLVFSIKTITWLYIDPENRSFDPYFLNAVFSTLVLFTSLATTFLFASLIPARRYKAMFLIVGLAPLVNTVPQIILRSFPVSWLENVFYCSATGKYWHLIPEKIYWAMWDWMDLLWGIMFLVLARTIQVRGTTGIVPTNHKQHLFYKYLAMIAIPVIFACLLGGVKYFNSNWYNTPSVMYIFTAQSDLIYGLWWVAAVWMIARYAGVPYWAVFVLLVPSWAITLASRCANVFDIGWLQSNLYTTGHSDAALLPKHVFYPLVGAFSYAQRAGVLYVALVLSKLHRSEADKDN